MTPRRKGNQHKLKKLAKSLRQYINDAKSPKSPDYTFNLSLLSQMYYMFISWKVEQFDLTHTSVQASFPWWEHPCMIQDVLRKARTCPEAACSFSFSCSCSFSCSFSFSCSYFHITGCPVRWTLGYSRSSQIADIVPAPFLAQAFSVSSLPDYPELVPEKILQLTKKR